MTTDRPTPRITFSSIANPNTWAIEGESKVLVFASPSEAKRAEELFSAMQRDLAEAREFQLEMQSAEYMDAQRYRYLRDRADENHDGPIICAGLGDDFEFLRGPECDAAIDAAMSRKGE